MITEEFIEEVREKYSYRIGEVSFQMSAAKRAIDYVSNLFEQLNCKNKKLFDEGVKMHIYMNGPGTDAWRIWLDEVLDSTSSRQKTFEFKD